MSKGGLCLVVSAGLFAMVSCETFVFSSPDSTDGLELTSMPAMFEGHYSYRRATTLMAADNPKDIHWTIQTIGSIDLKCQRTDQQHNGKDVWHVVAKCSSVSIDASADRKAELLESWGETRPDITIEFDCLAGKCKPLDEPKIVSENNKKGYVRGVGDGVICILREQFRMFSDAGQAKWKTGEIRNVGGLGLKLKTVSKTGDGKIGDVVGLREDSTTPTGLNATIDANGKILKLIYSMPDDQLDKIGDRLLKIEYSFELIVSPATTSPASKSAK